MTTTLLRNALLADGRHVDVVIEDGRIASVGPAGATARADLVHDLEGMLLLPAPAEPHAHLDKAFTADRVPNPAGDLPGAITAYRAYHASVEPADIEARAERAALLSLANGLTAIRTHVDLSPSIGLRAVEALVAVRDRLADVIDIQIVPLASPPVTGIGGADTRALLLAALDLGAEVVGGAPFLDPDPLAATELLVGLAAERGLLVDLHTDETLDTSVLCLRDYTIVASAMDHRGAAASHCVSLGVQSDDTQAVIAAAVAEAGVSVVTLPHTNLFLQARGMSCSAPRGLTAIHALRRAGANVAGGADNLQDPFNTMGRADPMETAALLVMAGHLPPTDAYEMVSTSSRVAMGLEPVAIAPGSLAELLAIDAANVREAAASAPGTRRVFHRGRLVASSDRRVAVHRADRAVSAPR